MSSFRAIAAVTATLQKVLADAFKDQIDGVTVTTQPPDKAPDDAKEGLLVNVFLYHTTPNAALRNSEVPRRGTGRARLRTPVALDLLYLISAYGPDNDPDDHQMLGRALSALHQEVLLDPLTLPLEDSSSYTHVQEERVRVTIEPVSVDEMYKLWSSFQASYRPSFAARVAPVIIVPDDVDAAPLPVLERDVDSVGMLPRLERVLVPHNQPAAQLGDTLILEGRHLAGDEVALRVTHQGLPVELELPSRPTDRPGRIAVDLTGELAAARAGIHALSVVVRNAGAPEAVSNVIAVPLAPRVSVLDPDPLVLADGTLVEVTFAPAVELGDQSAALLVRSLPDAPGTQILERELAPVPVAGATDRLTFDFAGVPAGAYLTRLRIDGVDSIPVDFDQRPPAFRRYVVQ